MGQKVNPTGLRVAVTKDWRSRWYADRKQDIGDLLHEDLLIRNTVKQRLRDAAVPEVRIERYANRARVTIATEMRGCKYRLFLRHRSSVLGKSNPDHTTLY